jgi:hypothetical protein
MTVRKTEIAKRIDSLKEWQENNSEKIHTDSHLEGYNSAINAEILFLQELLESKPVVEVAAPVVEAAKPVVKTVKKQSK